VVGFVKDKDFIVFKSRSCSRPYILGMIQKYKIENNKIELEKWELILKRKEQQNILKDQDINKVRLSSFLKMPNISFEFIKGNDFVIGKSGPFTRNINLNLKGPDMDILKSDYILLEKTPQYRNMKMLGFKTMDYRIYDLIYENNKIVISFKLGKIDRITINGKTFKEFLMMPNKNDVRILIRKGLTYDDIILIKGWRNEDDAY
jgi:hypothetical protein